jgi:hypothetical protein
MGVYEEERVWEKHWDKSTENLLFQYQQAYNRILKELLGLSGEPLTALDRKRQQELLMMIAQTMAELQGYTQSWVTTEIALAFVVGQASQMVFTGLAPTIAEGMKQVEKSTYAKQVLETVLTDTQEDLLYATQFTEKRTKAIVRDVFGQVMKQRTMENQGLRTIEREVKQTLEKKILEGRLKKDGFVGIIDAGGKKWKTETYVEMAVRTKIQESFRLGTIANAVDKGYDLGYISMHFGACGSCKPYENLIISLTGKTEGYPTYDSLKASDEHLIFHPRCKHKLRSVRTYDLIPDGVKKNNEEARKNVQDLL